MTACSTSAPAQPGASPASAPTSTGRRRPSRLGKPSVRAAVTWEARKAANRWYWPALALLCAIGMVLGWSNYKEFQSEFADQGMSWSAVWGQASLLTTMLAVPLLVGAVIAQMASAEHEGRNWQRMSANRLEGTMLVGKLGHMALVAVLSTLVLLAELLLTGVLLGFDLAGFIPFLARGVPIAMAIFAVELFVAWLGVRMTSFASIMSALLLATLAGCAVTVLAPSLGALFPLSLITLASASREPGSIASMASIVHTTAVCAGWAALWAVALRRSITRVA
ncbi:ABC transporter permease [Actinomyces sp. MRS3W]|uniref:ABC transporter permease n=1 Tax=Actinomyces sp. MRS3W TaxID=2800796 RepID=UPI0028FDB821|nr:ABC transporter permease [Actinomyces sp. MRS3W]MDU0348484.1 ABC transporter permease [Actinomyces sp. MRS3W]